MYFMFFTLLLESVKDLTHCGVRELLFMVDPPVFPLAFWQLDIAVDKLFPVYRVHIVERFLCLNLTPCVDVVEVDRIL